MTQMPEYAKMSEGSLADIASRPTRSFIGLMSNWTRPRRRLCQAAWISEAVRRSLLPSTRGADLPPPPSFVIDATLRSISEEAE